MNWDTIFSIVIFVVLILGFWAKMSGQTIAELLSGISDFIKDTKEDSVELATEIY